ncbi:MAG: transcriptional repressor LexA [Chloroflexia bacterium]
MVAPLSTRQRDVLNAILRHQRHHDYAPTVRELCEAVGVSSPNTIAVHLDALERKRYIQRHDGLARSIEVLRGTEDGPQDRGPKGMRILSLPIVGEIAAGLPIQANKQHDERFEIPFSMAGTEDAYILRVRGESMIDEHICNGDLVVVRPQQTARNGEIVVALVGITPSPSRSSTTRGPTSASSPPTRRCPRSSSRPTSSAQSRARCAP